MLNLNFKDITEYNFIETCLFFGSFRVSYGNCRILPPRLPSEHMISNALNHLTSGRTQSHGVQVAFATLLMEKARGKDLRGYIDFYRKVGLPTTLKEFGLVKRVSRSD